MSSRPDNIMTVNISVYNMSQKTCKNVYFLTLIDFIHDIN